MAGNAIDPAEAHDTAEVKALFGRFMQAWTDNDGEAFGRLFTEDADYVSYDGSWAAGRAQLQHNHEQLFRGVLKGSALTGEVESLRFPADGVAVLIGTGAVLMPWRRTLPKGRTSRQTMVMVRTGDGWRISSIQNGRVRPVTVPAPDSMPSKMSQRMTRVAARLGLGRAREVVAKQNADS